MPLFARSCWHATRRKAGELPESAVFRLVSSSVKISTLTSPNTNSLSAASLGSHSQQSESKKCSPHNSNSKLKVEGWHIVLVCPVCRIDIEDKANRGEEEIDMDS